MDEDDPKDTKARLLKMQAISGLIFAAFVLMHLGNHLFALGGPEVYDSAQSWVRKVYQWPVFELGFLGALLVHMASAVLTWRARRQSQRALGSKAPAVPRRVYWHRAGGWFLFMVILGHIGATRVLPWMDDVQLGFNGVAFAFWWLPLVFWPYYLALALFGLFHMAHGCVLAFGRLRKPLPRALMRGVGFWGPLGVMALALVFALLALDGRLFETPDPTDNDYARIYEARFGVELPSGSKATPNMPATPAEARTP